MVLVQVQPTGLAAIAAFPRHRQSDGSQRFRGDPRLGGPGAGTAGPTRPAAPEP
jgi:hypothetical protein